MKKFRHHTYFTKPKVAQAYRFPFVCLSCRKSFKLPAALLERHCPQCAGLMVMLSRKFSAPKCRNLAQWAKVRFLIEHGFRFYPVFDPCAGGMLTARYPDTLEQARWFVRRYASQRTRQCADLPSPTVDLHTDKGNIIGGNWPGASVRKASRTVRIQFTYRQIDDSKKFQ